MNKLSANPATHILIFKDGSKKYLNQKGYDVIWSKLEAGKKEILLNGSLISFSSISKILSLGEYFDQYPNERPFYQDRYKDLAGLGYEGIIKSVPCQRLEQMIIGIKRYINSDRNQKTGYPEELLAIMEGRLKLAS